jgi:hypothetical protein
VRQPKASEFSCPGGATATPGKTGIECIGRDGKTTGDTFAVEGGTGLMVHPLGLTVAWENGAITWWQLRPSGQRVVFEGGRAARIEAYEGGDLKCARHFEGTVLVRRFEDGKWVWLNKDGRPIEPKMPLDRSEISLVLKEHQPEVQLCYESRLHEIKGDFHGTVAVSVAIENGEAKTVAVSEDTLHDPPVADCLAERVRSWKFRPSSEAVDVVFPFVFKERR